MWIEAGRIRVAWTSHEVTAPHLCSKTNLCERLISKMLSLHTVFLSGFLQVCKHRPQHLSVRHDQLGAQAQSTQGVLCLL